MAHVEKYTISSCGMMLHHYRRDLDGTLRRENIDPERTASNYTLGRGDGVERIRERMAEVEAQPGARALRSNAVAMFDWVVTLPPDVPREREREFFERTFEHISRRYGDDNVLGGWVHRDETTPHMHVAVMPVVERDNGRLAFSAKEVLNRTELRSFHRELGDSLERDMGFRPMVELTEEMRRDRAVKEYVGLDEFKRATERLERLQRSERDAGNRNQELGIRVEELRREVERAREREQALERTNQAREEKAAGLSRKRIEARGRVAELEREVGRAAGECGALERAREALERRVGELRDAVGRARDAAREAFARVRECVRMFQRADDLRDRAESVELRAGEVARDMPSDQLWDLRQAEKHLAWREDLRAGCEKRISEGLARLKELERHPLLNRREIGKVRDSIARERASMPQNLREVDEAKERVEELRERQAAREGALEKLGPIRDELERLRSDHSEARSSARAMYDSLDRDQRMDVRCELIDNRELSEHIEDREWREHSRGLDHDHDWDRDWDRDWERGMER